MKYDLRIAVTKFPSRGRIHTSFFRTTTSCASNGYMVSYDDYDKIQPRFRDMTQSSKNKSNVDGLFEFVNKWSMG